MSKIIDLYLDRVLHTAELPEPRATEVRAELSDHLRTRYEASLASGENSEDAALEAISKMGSPKTVATQIARPWRWVDIRSHGTAKGFIAIGPRAIGVFAFGSLSAGIFAVGGISVGLVACGGLSLGLLVWAAFAVGLAACGAAAAGFITSGLVTTEYSDAPTILLGLGFGNAVHWIEQNLFLIIPIYLGLLLLCNALIRWRKYQYEKETPARWIFS